MKFSDYYERCCAGRLTQSEAASLHWDVGAYFSALQSSASQNLQPLLVGRKIVFENRRIPDVFEDRRSCCTRKP